MVQAIKRDEVFIEPEGIHVETHQPERRSRKPPLLLVHGALTGSWLWTEFAAYLAERGWEAHAMNLRGHFTSDVADLETTTMRDYADDVGVAHRHIGRPVVLIGWGIGALAALMHAERTPVLGLGPAGPLAARGGAAATPGRARAAGGAAVYDAAWWGWTGTPDELRERMPDMDDHDLEKMTELLGWRPRVRAARRERMQGVPIDASRFVDMPSLVIGAGPRRRHPSRTRRGAPPTCWARATSTSRRRRHFGLVMGSSTWPEVAQSVLGWLEERRPALAATASPRCRRSGRGDSRSPVCPRLEGVW